MEIAAKIAIYLTVGIALLACNIWFVSAAIQSISGGDLVVAPVKVVGGTGDASLAGETLARLIIARLQSLEWDLRQSQSSLKMERQEVAITVGPRGVTAGILGTPKTAVLNAQLFEPTNIDVKVAGVDVGGLLPRIQRWFVQDRTLTFAVSWEGKSAILAGNIDALGLGRTKPLWMSIENATANSIADAVALALIHRRWAKDSPEFGELEDEEFGKLVSSINEIARINRRVITYNVAAKADFERIFASVSPLADRIVGWNELTYFAASIAEGAENYERALSFYRRIQPSQKPQLDAQALAKKISALELLATKAAPEKSQLALRKLRQHVADAARILNDLFKASLPDPAIELISDDMLNAYWDGKKINVPPSVQDIPDVVYHEVAWPFIQTLWSFKYSGQEGALAQSYTDFLTSLVKQKMRNQTAQNADWVIAPGAIAWITGKASATDTRPLRSLKAPGTAYDDPKIGKDLQPDHFSKLVKSTASAADDFGGIHINSGIPNRAFYETAIRIGSDNAGKIWISSLRQFKPSVDLRTASKTILDTAVKLYGEESTEVKGVRAGWNAVGLL